MSNNIFADVLKIWGCDKYADQFNFDKAIASSRQNAKAFGDAAKAATDGLQLIANRQATILQRQSEEAQKFFSNFSSSTKNPETVIEQLTQAVKANTASAIANSKELFEVASKSASEAADILNKRFSAVVSECGISEASTSNSKKNAA